MRADGPGGAMLVRLMAVESGRRAANPGRPDIEVTHAGESMMRAVAVFVGRAVRGACPSLPVGDRKRPKTPSAACRPAGESGSDGALNRPFAQSRQGC